MINFERGDIIWVDLDPVKGHEQAKRRPCLVLTPRAFNRHGLLFIAPITSKVKGHPFEVAISSGKISGVVLVDHSRSIDGEARKLSRVSGCAPASAQVMRSVSELLEALLIV